MCGALKAFDRDGRVRLEKWRPRRSCGQCERHDDMRFVADGRERGTGPDPGADPDRRGPSAAFAWVLANRLQWGRWIYLVGGDKEAARRLGVPVDRVIISVFVLSGLLGRPGRADHRRVAPNAGYKPAARRAGRDLGRDHRRRVVLRWPRHGRRGDRRRADLRRDQQRAEPAQRQHVPPAHRDRRDRRRGGRARRVPAPARRALPDESGGRDE